MKTIECIIHDLKHEGFAFINEWCPALGAAPLASQVGEVIDIEKILLNSGIKNVQTLKPKERSNEIRNQYSGSYGFDAFPFHSDLAHWQLPPRYLLLRCIIGSKEVLTNLLPFSALERKAGFNTLKLALVATRRKTKAQRICPMPIRFGRDNNDGYRWDSLFLEPLNRSARIAYEIMSSTAWNQDDIIPACLEKAGDTLIIDNWKMLHNRSFVPPAAQTREIERVYLNRLL